MAFESSSLVSSLGGEFVCFGSSDAVDGIHLDKAGRPSTSSACLFDAKLMDGVRIGELSGGRISPVS